MCWGQIEITEIMYDHEGADSGFEWLEIHNTGASNVDIGSWYFYENETHHGLVPDGFSNLGPDERALIVQNLENIYGEYGTNLRLIKSSFSLNNTGETLSMSNPDKVIQDTKSYNVDDGAVGNGYSLQWTSSSWIEGAPTPGQENTSSSGESVSGGSASTSSSQQKKTTKEEVDYYTGYLHITSQAFVRSPVSIEAYVTHTNERRSIKKMKGGVYYINFGDGMSFESDERIDREHTYEYPGEYELVFEFHTSQLSKHAEDEPKVTIRKTLKVFEHDIEIVDIDVESGISIKNNTNSDIDLEGWQLAYQHQVHTFPKYSLIPKGKTVTIPKKVHAMGNITKKDWVILKNENNYTVNAFTLDTHKMQRVYDTPPSLSTGISSNIDEVYSLDTDIHNSQIGSMLDRFLKEHPEKEIAYFADTYTNDSEGTKENRSSIPLSATIVSGVLACALVIVRAVRKSKATNQEETLHVIGEIELIE